MAREVERALKQATCRQCCACEEEFQLSAGVECRKPFVLAAGAGAAPGGVAAAAAAASASCAAAAASAGGDDHDDDETDADGEAGPHFLCDECLSQHVATQCEPDAPRLHERQGHIFCPVLGHGCTNRAPFTDTDIAKHCPEAVFDTCVVVAVLAVVRVGDGVTSR
jgi:hypothetical protein